MKNGEEHSFYTTVQFVSIICCKCGVPFLVTKDFKLSLERSGDNFFCPNGHNQYFANREKDELKQKILQLNKTISDLKKSSVKKITWQHNGGRVYESEEFIIKMSEDLDYYGYIVYLKMNNGLNKEIGKETKLTKAKKIAEEYN